MTDRDVSAGCVVAVGLWSLTVVLLLVAWIAADNDVGRLGLATSAAAATATIRCYFVRQNKMLRNAFELGVESERVSRLR